MVRAGFASWLEGCEPRAKKDFVCFHDYYSTSYVYMYIRGVIAEVVAWIFMFDLSEYRMFSFGKLNILG